MELLSQYGFTKKEIEQLLPIELANGEKFFNLRRKDVAIEFAHLKEVTSFAEMYQYLTSQIWDSQTQAISESPLLKKEREEFDLLIRSMKERPPAVEGKPCPRCRSKNTVAVEHLFRRLDEPTVFINNCYDCSHKFR